MGLNPYFNGKCNFVYYESYVLILVLVEFAPLVIHIILYNNQLAIDIQNNFA